MSQTRYRIVLTLLGLALIVVIVGAVVITPDGVGGTLPEAVEAFSPTDGAIVQRQTDLEIDMKVGYRLELYVDDVRIPDAEIDFTEPTGIYVWRPGPEATFAEWTPGFHTVRISWDTIAGLPDRGELRWSFRIL